MATATASAKNVKDIVFEYEGKYNDYDKIERLLWEKIRSKLLALPSWWESDLAS